MSLAFWLQWVAKHETKIVHQAQANLSEQINEIKAKAVEPRAIKEFREGLLLSQQKLVKLAEPNSELATQEVPKSWEELIERFKLFLERYEILDKFKKAQFVPISNNLNHIPFYNSLYRRLQFTQSQNPKPMSKLKIVITGGLVLECNEVTRGINFKLLSCKDMSRIELYLEKDFDFTFKRVSNPGAIFKPYIFTTPECLKIEDHETTYVTLKKFINEAGLEF